MGDEEERNTRSFGRTLMSLRSVICLYEVAKTRVMLDSVLSEGFEVNVELHHGSVLSPFLFAVVVDVFTEFAREVSLSVSKDFKKLYMQKM